MNAMKYEGFLRGAFSIHLNTMINRSGDLGELAEADIFRMAESGDNHYFNEVKIGTGYAISIFNTEILNNNSVTNADNISMTMLFDQVLSATSTNDIISIIDRYIPYRDQYFSFKWTK